jgi:hypothetical protein
MAVTLKTHQCQFYAFSKAYGKRILFSFKVTNEHDAKQCLRRLKQPSGWYVVRDKYNGNVLINRRIYA